MEKENNITREAIVEIGEKILKHSKVNMVSIRIGFIDKSEINFIRNDWEKEGKTGSDYRIK